MNRRFMIALAALVSIVGIADADTLLVPQDFPTVQAAVTAAGPGDVIEIRGGRYAEDVVVTLKTDLTLVGKGSVTLTPAGTGLTADRCTNLVVEKIKVRGGATGFDLQDCSTVRLTRCSVKGVSVDGIHAAGSSNVRIEGAKIKDCDRDGISFADEEPGRPVTGGEITGCKLIDLDEDGIDILGSDVTVTNCSVKNADDDGFEADDGGSGPVTFTGCKSKNSGDEGFELFAPGSRVSGCASIRSGDDGFDIEGDGSEATDCKAVRADTNGFEVEVTEQVNVTGCTSVNSRESGFAVLDSSNCVLDGCSAVRSGEDGFFLDSDTSTITLRNNKAKKSRGHDLDDESGGANTIEGNNTFRTVDPNTP